MRTRNAQISNRINVMLDNFSLYLLEQKMKKDPQYATATMSILLRNAVYYFLNKPELWEKVNCPKRRRWGIARTIVIFRAPPEVRAKLFELATKMNTSVSCLVNWAVRFFADDIYREIEKNILTSPDKFKKVSTSPA